MVLSLLTLKQDSFQEETAKNIDCVRGCLTLDFRVKLCTLITPVQGVEFCLTQFVKTARSKHLVSLLNLSDRKEEIVAVQASESQRLLFVALA